MNSNAGYTKHIYWFPQSDFISFNNDVNSTGFELKPVKKTACETLNAKAKVACYASPKIFNGLCNRQGSWYRKSNKAGWYLVVSEENLPEKYKQFLDAVIVGTEFMPRSLPGESDIRKLVESEAYQSQRPDDWENKTFKEGMMFKIMFTLTGFWRIGDNLNKHWNNHRANHANFLSHQHTVSIDGEDIPYSVTDNNGVCSSCVEFFNIIDQDSRKMVRACPGAVCFTSVEAKKYYDVRPVKILAPVGTN